MAALVFTVKNVPRKLLDTMLGFAGGGMIAASFWSLLGAWREPNAPSGASKQVVSWCRMGTMNG